MRIGRGGRGQFDKLTINNSIQKSLLLKIFVVQ